MNTVEKFKKAIENANNILITTHLFPDADGIGSQISLCIALREIGKNAICCNEEPLLERYNYLDPLKVMSSLKSINKDWPYSPDLIIVVDTNVITRAGQKIVNLSEKNKSKVLYIDHHPCEQETEDNHCIDTTSAATGQLIGNLIESLDIEFTQEMALPLYTAILIDTSSFRYPTVSADTHRLIAKLMDTGVKSPFAYNMIYGTRKIEHMHLLSKVLESTNCNQSEEIAWLVLKKEDLNHYDIDIEDTHAFINHLLILDHVKVACMFRDDGDQIKLSLRSTGKFDVASIAIGLGGGGHSHSAATVIRCKESKDLDKIIKETISKIEVLIRQMKN